MALRSKEQWVQFFTSIQIPADQASEYASIFVENRITEENLPEFQQIDLQELGITAFGDIKNILKRTRALHTSSTPQSTPDSTNTPNPSIFMKTPAAKLPQLCADMTHPQFRKFRMDWSVFKKITNIPDNQIHAHIYSSCDDTVQNSLVNTVTDFFTLTEDQLLPTLKQIVTKKSNPAVHRLKLTSLQQSPGETIKDYVIRLKSIVPDCEYVCPHCDTNLSPAHLKDQFIRGINNESLQTDILAKASQLKLFEDVVKHAEAFEAAQRDQSCLQNNTDPLLAARISEYKRQNRDHSSHKETQPDKSSRPCPGCGSHFHGQKGQNDRSQKCPAWGRKCQKCKIPNHFARVCRQKPSEEANALIARVTHHNPIASPPTPHSENGEINATLSPSLPRHQHKSAPTNMKIFPDSGATVCLANPQHIAQLNLTTQDLIPCTKIVTVVGGSQLTCKGWLPITFQIGNYITKQPVYISNKADRIYFSKQGCVALKLLHPEFPKPMPQVAAVSKQSQPSPDQNTATKPKPLPNTNNLHCETTLPQRPTMLPFPPTEENIPKLKQYLLDQFSETTFNQSIPFPEMNAPAAHIHLKPNAEPYARHTPIPVPFHWKEAVKQGLDNDVKRGIITPVPIGTPTQWCCPMVITAKKNGQPRRTIDLQRLNSQCQRETHHTPSPFHVACQIPPKTKKTVLDAVDGYHAIPLDKESQPLTTFITEWGRYMYLRIPQGLISSGDAYTSRYDGIIKDFPRKVKIIDDTCLYDDNIEQSFYHTWDYLVICAKNGIVLNRSKFQFCQDTVEFAGLLITSDGISPSPKILAAIEDFPVPKDLTGARSWFGLVNQLAWAYSISPIMQPFRDLVKTQTKFCWTDTLDKLFTDSKTLIINKVKEGIKSFDINRRTCLQTDWSREGIGYLLLQQHCSCPPTNAPTCCPEGWQLVFAGSRFTTEPESRYAPTEGECLAVSWSLDNARMFVLGCKELIIVTDHKPLLGILNNRELNTISNPRLQTLKEKTLKYNFTVQYCPGKWQRGADSVSRYPCKDSISFFNLIRCNATDGDTTAAYAIEADTCYALSQNVNILNSYTLNEHSNKECSSVTIEHIKDVSCNDQIYQALILQIRQGFPNTRNNLDPSLRSFWEVRHRLTVSENIISMDNRLVIPSLLQKQVLHILHSAHQGVASMTARANTTVYWPGINNAIRNIRYSCKTCNEIAPLPPKEPLTLSLPPEWPFQKVCSDFFHLSGHLYLPIVDRFSGWLNIYHIKPFQDSQKTLISIFRSLFEAYGVPEELSTDGGPQFTATQFQSFLKNWGVTHRLSSAYYPQSNGRAELGVKTAKRILENNTNPDGTLDNDKVSRAILQYRNTPLPYIHLSPAQILFHRQLRDNLPSNPQHYKLHKNWLISAAQREQCYAKRNQDLITEYNRTAHHLDPLAIGAPVAIYDTTKHSTRRWHKTGTIVESLPYKQYRIKVHGSGRITLRNRRFLHEIPHPPNTNPIPSPTLVTTTPPREGVGESQPLNQPPQTTNNHNPVPTTVDTPQNHVPLPTIIPVPTDPVTTTNRLPRALRNLASYNKPGLKE